MKTLIRCGRVACNNATALGVEFEFDNLPRYRTGIVVTDTDSIDDVLRKFTELTNDIRRIRQLTSHEC